MAAARVASFEWVTNNELLVEVVSDTLALPISPVIGRCEAHTGVIWHTAQSATRIAMFTNLDYAFNRLQEDRLGDLMIVSRNGLFSFPDSLTNASGVSAAHFVVAGPTASMVIRTF
ncbi:MAG: hypothetical protein IPG71_12510 [bacterium]|nr:hypothetical protein [bacterium]